MNKAQSGIGKLGSEVVCFRNAEEDALASLSLSVCGCVRVCERVRACVSGCVCGYAQLRVNAVAHSMERWGK